MNMILPVSLSWREFLEFRFPSHARIADSASTQTAPYSANIPPDPEDFLCQSGLDPTLPDRVLRPLEAFLEQLGIIDDLVPSTVTGSISTLLQDIATQVLEREYDVVWMLQDIARIVSMAISALESSLSVHLSYSETGKMKLITRRYSDNQLQDVKVVAGQAMHPRVLYRYAKELQESQVYEPVGQEGGRAMAIKIWLQECTSTPQADFGLFFSGISAILTERVQHESGEHALLISPHYHLYDEDDPPKYDFCTPHDEGGLPLLAVLTSLLLPNIIVNTIPQLPALVQVETGHTSSH
ncbi:hypothetical protein EV421DRAFT_626930 [Armillaria borealis]|uniref:Uncharacterized protein n=1 Tax=Armillaria borealis TaxID=47425 RepID=A0AA39JF17_9AGAR|nr:hypothetical protein EV421DRAFT_626930 [Armillaria borealis]